MPQHCRQSLSESTQPPRRQCYSLRYKENTPNTPFYALPTPPAPSNRNNHRRDAHKQSDSFDTCESDSRSSPQHFQPTQPRENKIKVELCKNFVEKGYCPYENRCRFAHGVEELRARDTWGTCELYRTRKCKIFYEKHECKFGERCNFMHDPRKLTQILTGHCRAVREALRINFGEIELEGYSQRVQESKLMGLLGHPQRDLNN